MIQNRIVIRDDMDFGNPGFIEDQCGQVFLDMNASDASAHERGQHQFQPPTPEDHNRLRIDQNELVGRQVFLTFEMGILLKERMCQTGDGKGPDTAGVDELGIVGAGGNEFDTAAEFALGSMGG